MKQKTAQTMLMNLSVTVAELPFNIYTPLFSGSVDFLNGMPSLRGSRSPSTRLSHRARSTTTDMLNVGFPCHMPLR
jgi:hypothetical protein